MIYDPINILWIEDNPLQNALYGSQINERSQSKLLDESFDYARIPAVYFNDENRDLYKYFSLKVLQHPEEIREYISACLEVEDKKGAQALGNTSGAVPEIIAFDYQMSNGIDLKSAIKKGAIIPYKPDFKPIRENLNPIYEIYKMHDDLFKDKLPFFENDSNLNYKSEDFIRKVNGKLSVKDDSENKENKNNLEANENSTVNSGVLEEIIKKDIGELEHDQLGLFAGVVVSRLFKEHSCVAIPSTWNFSDLSRMHISSKFFEWINGYDLGDIFNSNIRGQKEWDKIIPYGVGRLRIRIEKQVETGKIIPNYEQLIELSKANTVGGVFSFISVYGERNLPLDGLFIDIPEEARKRIIKNWANDKLLANLPLENEVIAKAKEVGDELWEIYKNEFGERIDLAEYCYRKDELGDPEQKEFNRLKEEFSENGRLGKELSILELLPDYNKNIPTLRLATLYVVAQGIIAMNSCIKFSLPKEIYSDFDEYEYFNMLFPKILYNNYDFLLPMHVDGDTERGNMIANNGARTLQRNLFKNQNLKNVQWYEFDKWIQEGEKQVLRMMLYQNKKHFPNWLQ